MSYYSELRGRILKGLKTATELSDYFYSEYECLDSYAFSRELNSAHRFVSGAGKKESLTFLAKLPEITGLLNNCAKLARDNGFAFLAAEFEELAADAGSWMPTLLRLNNLDKFSAPTN